MGIRGWGGVKKGRVLFSVRRRHGWAETWNGGGLQLWGVSGGGGREGKLASLFPRSSLIPSCFLLPTGRLELPCGPRGLGWSLPRICLPRICRMQAIMQLCSGRVCGRICTLLVPAIQARCPCRFIGSISTSTTGAYSRAPLQGRFHGNFHPFPNPGGLSRSGRGRAAPDGLRRFPLAVQL